MPWYAIVVSHSAEGIKLLGLFDAVHCFYPDLAPFCSAHGLEPASVPTSHPLLDGVNNGAFILFTAILHPDCKLLRCSYGHDFTAIVVKKFYGMPVSSRTVRAVGRILQNFWRCRDDYLSRY